ncbi:hypothetical protein Vse01_44970 [Micromonospora sediminimaris]|uniref:Uncharacterized protein n=1 Tax=Micromonospora sediminimaris TaxID=547162 RepID=A0A9W5UVA7_9ACTN|nr:hypothetical protein Vse01_44970 [Micromonospora sediminimaris]
MLRGPSADRVPLNRTVTDGRGTRVTDRARRRGARVPVAWWVRVVRMLGAALSMCPGETMCATLLSAPRRAVEKDRQRLGVGSCALFCRLFSAYGDPGGPSSTCVHHVCAGQVCRVGLRLVHLGRLVRQVADRRVDDDVLDCGRLE